MWPTSYFTYHFHLCLFPATYTCLSHSCGKPTVNPRPNEYKPTIIGELLWKGGKTQWWDSRRFFKTANKKEAAFKRKYQEFYFNHRFNARWFTFSKPSWYNMCLLVTESSKLLCHMEIRQPALKDKPLELSKRKYHKYKEQKQVLKPITSWKVSVLRTPL